MNDLLNQAATRNTGSNLAKPLVHNGYRVGVWIAEPETEISVAGLCVAAERLGHRILLLGELAEARRAAADFAIASIDPRQERGEIPTFGLIRETTIGSSDNEKERARSDRFEGYLTAFDSVRRVLTGSGSGDAPEPLIGFFELTPERQFITCQIEKLIGSGAFRLCGIANAGEPDADALQSRLASRSYFRGYGTGASESNGLRALPSSRRSMQLLFASFGAGLVTLRHEQQMDSAALRRFCEIVSVGAVAICPDIPWIRRRFGDTVQYYPATDLSAAVEAIGGAIEAVTSAPTRAAGQAREAKAIFDESLAAEVMLQNAVAFFEEWRLRPRDRTAHPGGNRAGRRSTRRLVAASRPEAARPLVSLILTVKNGMPFIGSAIESIRGQLYANLQLVVQDCMSDDGSSELLAGIDDIEVDLVREPDGGIGDAVSRALSRCRGPIVGSIDSDNLLRPGALHRVAEHFGRFPAEAAVYGAVEMIDEAGANLDLFRPARFNLLRVLECELVPPWSTAFFRRDALTDAFQSGASLKTCADFSAWLHLGHLPIGYIDEPLGSTRLSGNSMTCNVDAYEQFCNDKIEALSRYLAECKQKSLRQALLLHGKVGIYCWAAGSIAGLDPTRKDLVQSFIGRARAIAPTSARLADMSEKIDAMNSD